MQSYDKKKSIVFFDEAVAFGGSVVVLSHLLRHIDRTRYVPLVVTSLDEASARMLFAPGDILVHFQPKLHYANRIRWMRCCPNGSRLVTTLWGYVFALMAAILNMPGLVAMAFRVARARPAIVHVNNGNEGLFLSRLLRVPLVWHLHGMSFELRTDKFKARTRAASFVSVSRYIAGEAVRRGVPPERIVVVPNPAPASRARPVGRDQWLKQYGLKDSAIVLAHVGRLVPWKGQLEFLDAFSRIAADHPDAVALIVGDDAEGSTADYPREVRSFVDRKNLNDRVVFAGHVTNVMELMSYSDVVVHSSIEPEPFGLVIVEAMSAGAAVIAARLGAPVEIVDHGKTGLLVDPKDPVEFAGALHELLHDGRRRREIAHAGQVAVRERYSPELFAERMMDVYDRVLAKGSGIST